MEERLRNIQEEKIQKAIDGIIKEAQTKAQDVLDTLDRNEKALENIQNRTGFVSLYEGFDKYANRVEEKLKPIRREIKILKPAILVFPMIASAASIFYTLDWRYYTSTAVVVAALGLFLRINLKKQDQYEQIISQVENKAAISIFHESSVSKMEEQDLKEANAEFFKFIYAPIETSEWHVPDLTDGLVRVAKEFNKKSP